jgi:hypothetical protein
MPLKEKKLVFNSLAVLDNGNQIGPDKRPYLFGYSANKLGIFSLPQNNKLVGTLATTPSYTLGSSVKITLMDSGALNIYIGDSLHWTSLPSLAPPTNNSTIIGTDPAVYAAVQAQKDANAAKEEKSLFSNPVVLAGLAFAAYKFFTK